MSAHLDGMKRILDPEIFEYYKRRCGEDTLQMREEVAEKFKDLNPPGYDTHMLPESWTGSTCLANWIRERGGWDMETNYEMEGKQLLESSYRIVEHAMPLCRKVLAEKLPPEELIKTKYLCYPSMPPIYVVRPDLGFATNQLLYGKYATVMWAMGNYWTGEFDWFAGWHNEDGVPQQAWQIGGLEECYKYWPPEDLEKFVFSERDDIVVTRAKPGVVDREKDLPAMAAMMERRHLRTGIKMRELPKKCPYHLHEWLRPARDIGLDLREEYFPKWTHATVYYSLSPGNMGIATWHNFWATSQWWNDPWNDMNAMRVFGIPIQYYTYEPLPPILNTMLALPKEVFTRRLGELFLMGPKGLLCDAITKLMSPEKSTPLEHDLRRRIHSKGKIYKDFALPYDDGIPPPAACLTALTCPFYKEANMSDIVANPSNLSKEYWDLLESEGGVDRKTGRIPPYSEVPRLKWLFDPTIEWFKPKDFPPIEWTQGQVWPIDVTREKMEIMVEEGYDGSGKDILHYSALADKKMGREGKTIILGTMPYKLPTE